MTTNDLERRLREVLHREAERIKPHERRTEILAMVHDDEKQIAEPRRRWLIPGAAAASVALIGAVIWGVSNTGSSQQATPAMTSASAPAIVSPDATSNGSVAGATTQVALPAYFVGANTTAGDQFGLYREFIPTAVPVGATPAQKAKAAVAAAMNAQPFTNYEPYIQPWSGTSVTDVMVTPSLITITLSGPGASGFTAAQTKLAVQELVWTAQAAIGQGTTPMKFVVANGSPALFGTYPTTQTYNRPTPDLQYEVLAPIWITTPVRNHLYPAGATVVAAGQSCSFEGTTQWQLKKSTTTVKSGVATASSGCPTRGTWQVKLGVLAAGDYTFRMSEVSMKDGKVVAETSKPFSVK
jgi:Immunoglobulin-like domain of bacterial spore germination